MLKKWTASVLAFALFALPMTSVPIYAADASKEVIINNGQINSGRVLIPLRAVSENLGANVKWSQENKEVKIQKGDSTIRLAANFKGAIVETPPTAEFPNTPHREYISLDTATQIMKGTTYVPLGFVSQSLGASVTWDNKAKKASVVLDGKHIIINMDQPSVQIPEKQKITDARLKVLSEKLNEAGNTASLKNVSAHFKPYFTDKLIKSVVQNKGLGTENTYTAPITLPEYISQTKALLSQSVILANGLMGEDQYIEDRSITLVFTNGVWKVDNVSRGSRTLITGYAFYE
ncbi:copper amine oxidase N-terminal domain-containing protein [Paenibacillus sp. FSL W8-0194]|uniref:copper amine oxidase N-terminal domain-containing protein n=1 Tax=Paenibacillus sp. FSL W8-0194 TaxID=2921711 RepID=UPI0030DD30AB